jgi:hypothetical protein
MKAHAIYGALGGVIGAACMTVFRTLAHRRGVIDKSVPQAAEEWLTRRTGRAWPAEPAVHHAFDQLLHFGYGAALGAAYGAVVARPRRPGRKSTLVIGSGFGAAAWLFGSWLLLPLLDVKRAPWRASLPETAVDLAAHLIYGASTALLVDELAQQTDHLPSPDGLRLKARVG